MKKERKTIIKKNYSIEAAGTFWTFSEVEFTTNIRGNLVIKVSKLIEYQKAIGNYICSVNSELTIDEFEFLCSLTSSSFTELAKVLRIDPSTITRWFDNVKKKPISYPNSYLLKRYFWSKLFADIDRRGDPEMELDGMRKMAINANATIDVRPVKDIVNITKFI